MLSRVRFECSLKIDRVTRIPQSSGRIQVRWHVTDSPRADTRGKTSTVPIEDHQSVLRYEDKFTYSLGIGMPSKRLRSGNVVLEVLWEPQGAHKMPLGSVTLDLAQFIHRPLEPLAFLLENSRVNCLLFVQLTMEQIRGASDYKIPEFTAPVLKTDIAAGIGLGDVPSTMRTQPTIKSAAARLMEKKVFYNYLKTPPDSPFQLSPVDSVNDIFRGGTGFGNLAKPPLIDQVHKKGEPYTEEEVRDNLISWAVKF